MHSVHRLISLLFVTVLCFFSCSKEKVAPNFFKEAVSSDDQQVSDRDPISIKEARNWFTTTYGLQKTISNPNTLPNTMLEVAPVWAFAQTAAYLSGPIVVCPIRSPAQAHSLARFFLIFQKSSNQIVAQVVIFRAEDGSMISGKPLTLGQFSGVIGSLDFQGNYIGAMHLIKDGKQTGEINPLLNGNGLINGDANNGNVYSQVPWWQTNGGGWNNVYVTGTHNITTSVYTSITSGAHPSSGGGTTGGGSGYTSGPPNTNPLDNHFQNLLTNPLYTLEEYLYNHNLDANVFDYLSNTAKTILANRLYFIDLSYDFLQAHNNSSAAQAFIADIIVQIAQYNLSFLVAEDLQMLFDHPEIYNAYKLFLTQYPNATEEQKTFPLRFVFEGPDHPLENLPFRLNCFNTTYNSIPGAKHKVTIYIDQPIDNSNYCFGTTTKAGHAWIGLQQTINGETKDLSVGLYPQGNATPLNPWSQTGAFSHDQNRNFDVSITWNISPEQFTQLVNHLRTYTTPPNYALYDYNCTTFALTEVAALGIQVPTNNAVFPTGIIYPVPPVQTGYCPGATGEEIRQMQSIPNMVTVNTVSGTSPTSSCQ